MAYLKTGRRDFSDLASGRVLHSAPGYPAFPVRLADEIFQRAAVFVAEPRNSLWDPCCGSGYLASVVGSLNRDRLANIDCSDISGQALTIAARNLALLTGASMTDRTQAQRQLAISYAKPDHERAAQAADRLLSELNTRDDPPTRQLRINALDAATIAAALPPSDPDLVITDVPYGWQTSWLDTSDAEHRDPVTRPCTSLGQVLRSDAVVAISCLSRKVKTPDGFRASSHSSRQAISRHRSSRKPSAEPGVKPLQARATVVAAAVPTGAYGRTRAIGRRERGAEQGTVKPIA